MKLNPKRVAVIVVAALLVSSGIGAAAVSWDTETTNTTTTSDVDGSTTSITVHHGDSSQSTWFEATVDDSAANYTLQIRTDDAMNYVVYENGTHDVTDATNNHIAWNVTHDELADIPRDVDGNSYEVRIINDSDPTDNTTSSITINPGAATENVTAVMHVTDDAGTAAAAATNLVADTSEYGEKFGYFGAAKWWSDNGTNTSTWSGWSTISGNDTTLEVHMENTTAASSYDAVAEGTDDGEWMTSSTLFLNGKAVKVYDGSAPDSVGDDEDYAVYNENEDVVEITIQSEELSDVSTLYVRGGAGERYSFGTLNEHFGFTTALAAQSPI